MALHSRLSEQGSSVSVVRDDTTAGTALFTNIALEVTKENLKNFIKIIIIIIIIVGQVAQSVYRLSYGLDGPRTNPGGDEIFRPSRPALGPTHHPIK